MNMVDGIFAVAITLIPTSLPNTVPPGEGFLLIENTATFVVVGFTMLLIWHKLRNVLQINPRLFPQELALLGVVLAVVVLIPKSAYLAINSEKAADNLWHWSDAQWVNVEYQFLLLLVEIIILYLTLLAFRKPNALRYSMRTRRSILYTEIAGLSLQILAITSTNIITGVDVRFVYFAPTILMAEELACTLIMKRSPKPIPKPRQIQRARPKPNIYRSKERKPQPPSANR